ncbi:hypothetical protein MalM25_16320 [Planctomycetes bacterium MalM25]|nr:hypothetical protein MalM25_16320 [Planctomycetes bacterium MalM25]
MFERRSPLARPRWIWALASIAALAGCGDGKIARYPVSGSVLVDGKPYEGARVFLNPISGNEAFMKERPFGTTDEAGRFELTTFGKADGAPAGEYTVVLRNGTAKNPDQYKRWAKRPSIGREYGKPDTSPIKVTIEAGPNELAPFEAKSRKK